MESLWGGHSGILLAVVCVFVSLGSLGALGWWQWTGVSLLTLQWHSG